MREFVNIEWASKIANGTTSWRYVEIRDANDVYCLIRIQHPGHYDRGHGRTLSGFTEWFVCRVNSSLGSYGYPEKLWCVHGKLTKMMRTHIKNFYNLKWSTDYIGKYTRGGKFIIIEK